MLFFVQCAYMKLRPAPETVIRVRWDAEKRDAYCGRLRLAAARAKESPMPATPSSQLVIVVDFGAQYGQLIARRVRDLHVYSEIVPCDVTASEVAALAPAAIILSGGPASVYAEDAPSIDPGIFELGIPVLGFCYGQQIMAVTLGGTAIPTPASTGRPP